MPGTRTPASIDADFSAARPARSVEREPDIDSGWELAGRLSAGQFPGGHLLSPDNRLIAYSPNIASLYRAETDIYHATTGLVVRGGMEMIVAAFDSQDPGTVIGTTSRGGYRLISVDLRNGAERTLATDAAQVFFSPDRRQMIVQSAHHRQIRRLDPVTHDEIWRAGVRIFLHTPGDLRFSPDGSFLIATGDSAVYQIDANTGRELHRIPRRTAGGNGGTGISSCGRYILVGHGAETRLFDSTNAEIVGTLPFTLRHVSLDGHHAIDDQNRVVRLQLPDSVRPLWTLPEGAGACSYSPDNSIVLVQRGPLFQAYRMADGELLGPRRTTGTWCSAADRFWTPTQPRWLARSIAWARAWPCLWTAHRCCS